MREKLSAIKDHLMQKVEITRLESYAIWAAIVAFVIRLFT